MKDLKVNLVCFITESDSSFCTSTDGVKVSFVVVLRKMFYMVNLVFDD